MMINRFHYLTQDLDDISHVAMALDFCKKSKIDWLQLRMKNKSDAERLNIGREVREICNLLEVKLIINDYVELAENIDADGVHLGQNDMPIKEARAILGFERIIGGTANTFEDIKKLYEEGVDYIGLGPYRFTDTKKNLSEFLGVSGYNRIIKLCRESNIDIPIIAIGGIQVKDVPVLMHTGIHGVAISSAINSADDNLKMIEHFQKAIDNAIAVRN